MDENPTQDPFDRAARRFAALGEHLWRPLGAATTEATAPRAGERILDACCGDGASAIPAARAVGPEGHVDAVDMSDGLLSLLEERGRQLPQLHPRRADVTAWSDGDYDAVQCGLGVFFFPDMQSGSEHLVRRARPGGRVTLTIWRHGAIEDAGRRLLEARTAVTGAEPAPRSPRLIHEIDHPDTFRSWLEGLGLRDVRVRVHEHRLTMSDHIAWLLVLGSGYVGLLSALDEAQIDEVRRRYLASIREDGSADLDATVLIGTGVRPA